MSQRMPDDAEIAAHVRRAVEGDADGLSELLALFGPRVEAQLKIGRPWQALIEPGDVMQVTYLEAFLQISTFRPDQSGSFEAWLRRIAENNLRDAIRGLDRQKQLPPARRIVEHDAADSYVGLYEQLAATSTTPSRLAARNDIHRLLQAAVDRLPPDYARTVRLYDLEGRSITDVSAVMGRSAGAVHMLRARAHERLVELLGTASAWFGSNA
ncbi:MAG: RNA polymerase sigma factor [Phycisphaerae bacterium]|nr:RNA polymerase sigma factor [Phycisphaerae bacterium]